jgi:hypothetical protein
MHWLNRRLKESTKDDLDLPLRRGKFRSRARLNAESENDHST